MVSAQQRLLEWLKRSRLTYRAAGELLGIHWAYLYQLANKRRTPGLRTALRIERMTGVSVSSWKPTRVAKRSRGVSKTRETAA